MADEGGHPLRLRLLGSDLVAETRSAQERRTLAGAWSRCRAPDRCREDPEARLLAESRADVASDDAHSSISEQITEWALAAAAGRFLLLHACGLSDDRGNVAALVGQSGAGKSTAARTLGTSFGYVSDEVVAVAADGSVEPFPRPLAVIGDHWPAAKTQVGPDDLGLLVHPDQMKLRRLVVLDRHPPAGGVPVVTPLSLTESLIEVVPQVSYLRALDRPLCALAAALSVSGPVRLAYTEIADTADLLRDLLREPRAEPTGWSAADDDSDDEESMLWALSDGRVRRRPFADAIRVDDQVVLLVDRTPVVLSGIGPTIWRAAGHAPTFDELLTTIEANHGPHPDAATIVEDALDSLSTAGVIGYRRPQALDDHRRRLGTQPTEPAPPECRGPDHAHD